MPSRFRSSRLASWLLILACCGCSRQPRIELKTGDNIESHFEVVGLSPAELAAFEKLDEAARARAFRVFVVSDFDDPPALAGKTSVVGDRLIFTPRYPFEVGPRYRAVLRPAELSDQDKASGEISAVFEIHPLRRQLPAQVTHIYPSSIRLPENQLKFYIHFSAPMSRGEAYKHIHLRDANGKEVEGAFLELGEELWNPEQTRFTLLCDPGRVKRGLKPREELGPVLHEGQRYTLVVDRNWPDATGARLAMEMPKAFVVGPPDETPIDPAAWKIEPPRAGTVDALVVRFPEPLDHSLLSRVLWVTSAAGEKLAGEIDVTANETCWRFRPLSPWPSGQYHLVAQTTLEDLAGNAIGRPFEVDEFRAVQESVQSETVELPFVVRKWD